MVTDSSDSSGGRSRGRSRRRFAPGTSPTGGCVPVASLPAGDWFALTTATVDDDPSRIAFWNLRDPAHVIEQELDPGRAVLTASGRSAAVLPRRGGVLRLYDVEGGATPAAVAVHALPIDAEAHAPARSRDGRRFAVADGERIHWWRDVERPEDVAIVEVGDMVGGLVFTADGGELIALVRDGRLLFWSAPGEPPVERSLTHGAAYELRLSPTGDRLVVHGSGGDVSVWDPAARRELASFSSQAGAIRGHPAIQGDVLVVPHENDVEVIDLSGRAPVRRLRSHGARVSGCALSPDGGTLATVSVAGTAKRWDLTRPDEPIVLRGDVRYDDVRITADDKHAVAVTVRDDLDVYRLRGGDRPGLVAVGRVILPRAATASAIVRAASVDVGLNSEVDERRAQALDAGAQRVAIAYASGHVRLFSLDFAIAPPRCREVWRRSFADPVVALAFAHSGEVLVVGGAGGDVIELGVEAAGARSGGERWLERRRRRVDLGTVDRVVVSPDLRYLAVLHRRGTPDGRSLGARERSASGPPFGP